MKWLPSIFAALIFLFQPSAKAADASIRFYEWHTPQTIRPILLPVKASETPEQAAARYLRELERQPELMELFEGRAPDLSQGEFKPFGQSEALGSRALIMANAPRDYTKNSGRLQNFSDKFAEHGTSSYILPINANLGLTRKETRELFKLIASEFPLLVLLGGDDITPELYKQKNFHALNTIRVRDEFEIALVRAYVAEGKGMIFAVCRGAQMVAVALGYKLVQDIVFHINGAVAHANDNHAIKLFKTTAGILAKSVKGFKNLIVNSLHHQFILHHEGGPLEIAAQGPDGINEAFESKDGRIFITQWHPELMMNALGDAILKQVITQKNKFYAGRCEGMF
jgi:putative glutamine amidotransferase